MMVHYMSALQQALVHTQVTATTALVIVLSTIAPSLTFGDSSRVKILKKLKPTLVGANNSVVFLKWAYDFDTTYATAEFTVGTQITGFYGESEYTTVEFTGGQLTNARSLNTTGYGTSVQVGLESEIDGFALSLQEINVMALIGKLL